MTQEDPPGLGLFSRLPEEVCEMIWEHLMPRGEATLAGVVFNRRKMSILRVSRQVYHEVSAMLYENAMILFNFSPNTDWCRITYSRYRRHLPEHGAGYRSTTWIIDGPLELYVRGFSNFPFHRLASLSVIAITPDINNMEQLHAVWQKAMCLVQILSQAVLIQNLVVQHFVHGYGTPRNESSISPFARLDLGAVLAPFLALPNVKNLHTRLYEAGMDGLRLEGQDLEHLTPAAWQDPTADMPFKLITTWMQLQWFFWNQPRDGDVWGCRAQWVETALLQHPSPFIEFHKRYWQMLGRYPAVMADYDPEFTMIYDMHLALKSLYHYATGRYHNPQAAENTRVWHAAFRFCPFRKVEYNLTVESRYREYMRLYGYHHEHMLQNYAGVKLREQVYGWCM